MKSKVKAKVLKAIFNDGFEIDYKRVVLDFDEYISNKEIYNELISMKTTQYSVVNIIREVWEEVKGGF